MKTQKNGLEIKEMKALENLEKPLSDLKKIADGKIEIESVAVITRDGHVVKAIGQKVDDPAAMLATMVGAAETATAQLGMGIPEAVIIKTKIGRVLIVGAGPKALLAVVAGRSDVSIDLLLTRMQRTAEQVKQILG